MVALSRAALAANVKGNIQRIYTYKKVERNCECDMLLPLTMITSI